MEILRCRNLSTAANQHQAVISDAAFSFVEGAAKYNTVKAGIRCTVQWTVTNSSAPKKFGAVSFLMRSIRSLIQKSKIRKSYSLLEKHQPKTIKSAKALIKDNVFDGNSDGDEFWILKAYDNFVLIKEQACAAYVRHVKQNSFGKEDTRKVEKVIATILKNEGLWETQWVDLFGNIPHLPIIVEFCKISIVNKGVQLSSPYDNGIKYEEDCKNALEEIGASVRKTSSGADYGADLIFEYEGFNFVAQCKALSKKAGIKCVQEVVAAKLHYEADAAAAFSISGFSDAAEEIATSNKVLLFTGTKLESINRQIGLFFK